MTRRGRCKLIYAELVGFGLSKNYSQLHVSHKTLVVVLREKHKGSFCRIHNASVYMVVLKVVLRVMLVKVVLLMVL